MKAKVIFGALALTAAMGAQAALSVGGGALPGSFITLSILNVTGGAIYPASLDALPNAAIPVGSVGPWIAAGGSGNDGNGGGDAVLSVAGATGVSFLWGSPDTYNAFSVTTSAGTTDFTAVSVATAAGGFALNGDRGAAYYVNFTTSGGETLTSIAFRSTTNAIEISNVTVVPEPGAIGLALAALGVLGAFRMRRKVG